MNTKQVAISIIVVALLGSGIWWYLSEPITENSIVPEPVLEPVPEPIVVEPKSEPVLEPVIEPIPEPRSKPVPEPIVMEPVVEPIPEPIVEPIPEPIVEPVDEPEPEESGPRIIITLPFDPQSTLPNGMMPMGETVHHEAEFGGHAGIDFQWVNPDEPPKFYSSAEGEIVELVQDGNDWRIVLFHTGYDNKYYTKYNVGSYNTELEVGDVVEKFTFLGIVPSPHPEDNMFGTHWEFGLACAEYRNGELVEECRFGLHGPRLCPLTYFDEDSLILIETIWETAKYKEKDQFPLICNLAYEGLDAEALANVDLQNVEDFVLRSNSFEDEERIPIRFTCDGIDISPHLEWIGAPSGTVSFALEMHDPDAPRSGGWTHWIVFDIGPEVTSVEVDSVPEGGKEARNSFGRTPYGGPCPPSGTHRYVFKIYALDIELGSVSSLQDLHNKIEGHIIAEAKLTGLYSRR